MEHKDPKYYVKINPEFLFDIENKFKSRNTPWVYLYLKLEKNYYLDHHLKNPFSVDTDAIANLYRIDRSTVHRCINELIALGLVVKDGRDSYKIISETYELFSKANYIQIYKNLLINIFDYGGKIDDALIYFFMIQNNRHYAFEDDFLVTQLTQSKISRELKLGQRKVKASINKLKSMGLIAHDENDAICTKSPKADWNLRFQIRTKSMTGIVATFEENENHEINQGQIEFEDFFNNHEKKQEPVVCFWKKSRDGKSEVPVVKSKYHGYAIDSTMRRKADGIPMTDEEWEKQNQRYSSLNNSVRTYGYDANNYTQYAN